jgi:hypothetical protein
MQPVSQPVAQPIAQPVSQPFNRNDRCVHEITNAVVIRWKKVMFTDCYDVDIFYGKDILHVSIYITADGFYEMIENRETKCPPLIETLVKAAIKDFERKIKDAKIKEINDEFDSKIARFC